MNQIGDEKVEESPENLIPRLVRRVELVEREITTLKTLITGGISPPPRTDFEKTVDLSLEKTDLFYKAITRVMRQETRDRDTHGVAVMAGLYENEKTGQKAWWASRQNIEALLSQEEDAFEKASALAKSLSSPMRLGILRALCHGPKRFGELATITGVRGGQLTHHLDPLTTQQQVRKEEDRYTLTNKGWESLLAILLANQAREKG